MNSAKEFFEKNIGFIIGLIIGILLVILKVTNFIFNLAIMIGFGLLGSYVQKNKEKVKNTLKNIIDKM